MRGLVAAFRWAAPPVGWGLAAASRLVLSTSAWEERGPGAGYVGPAVYVNWHRHLPLLVPVHGRHRRWMMVSGAPKMAPIAAWCERVGLQLVRGASGEGGRQALARLAEVLRRGESVALAVDGPAGPVFQVKPGCLELARTTGAPVIPIAYRSEGAFTVPRRWDRMLLVRPFDRISVEVGAPLFPAPGEAEAGFLARLAAALFALDPRAATA